MLFNLNSAMSFHNLYLIIIFIDVLYLVEITLLGLYEISEKKFDVF